MSAPRHAAVPLNRDAERAWDRLRAEFTLHDGGFWLGFVFGAQPPVVDELIARTRDLARARVRRIEIVSIDDGTGSSGGALHRLLSPATGDLAATWVTSDQGSGGERDEAWARFLRRLNERRDALRAARPSALLLACPAGSLPMVRDEAPDLWSFRNLTATLGPRAFSRRTLSGRAAAPHPVTQGRLTPVPGRPAQPSPEVAGALKTVASALRSDRIDRAQRALDEALSAAAGPADTALTRAWLAQVRDRQGEPSEAVRHAEAALAERVPLERATSEALLGILVASARPEVAEEAAGALVAMARELVRRSPESPEALSDLSVSLDRVAGIQRLRGDLDHALAGYTESLTLRRRIRDSWGDTPETLRDLSSSLTNVARIHQARGDLDNALAGYTESLTLRRRIHTSYGDTPETLRDLSISLDNVARIHQARGDLDAALTGYTEARDTYRLFAEQYPPPVSDPGELARLDAAVAELTEPSPDS